MTRSGPAGIPLLNHPFFVSHGRAWATAQGANDTAFVGLDAVDVIVVPQGSDSATMHRFAGYLQGVCDGYGLTQGLLRHALEDPAADWDKHERRMFRHGIDEYEERTRIFGYAASLADNDRTPDGRTTIVDAIAELSRSTALKRHRYKSHPAVRGIAALGRRGDSMYDHTGDSSHESDLGWNLYYDAASTPESVQLQRASLRTLGRTLTTKGLWHQAQAKWPVKGKAAYSTSTQLGSLGEYYQRHGERFSALAADRPPLGPGEGQPRNLASRVRAITRRRGGDDKAAIASPRQGSAQARQF